MSPLGQLTRLPLSVANNPFHRLMVKFARFKAGSWEFLFTVESFLVRYAWFGLLVLFALVLPPLEEIDFISTLVRLSTLVYPFFFIWSLTRLAGTELMQLVLEGHWSAELLATPQTNGDLTQGFVSPVWLVVRQYFLISIFSLALYSLETATFIVDFNKQIYYVGDLVRLILFLYGLFFSVIGWIIFIYMARLFTEVRLRNGLIKGLFTMALLALGALLFIAYLAAFFYLGIGYGSYRVIGLLFALTLTFVLASMLIHVRLARSFRNYLIGQVDIDPMIFDRSDPHTTAWEKL